MELSLLVSQSEGMVLLPLEYCFHRVTEFTTVINIPFLP